MGNSSKRTDEWRTQQNITRLLNKMAKSEDRTERKIANLEKEISDVEQKFSRANDTYERNLIKMRDLRNYLEKAIESTTKKEIKITL